MSVQGRRSCRFSLTLKKNTSARSAGEVPSAHGKGSIQTKNNDQLTNPCGQTDSSLFGREKLIRAPNCRLFGPSLPPSLPRQLHLHTRLISGCSFALLQWSEDRRAACTKLVNGCGTAVLSKTHEPNLDKQLTSDFTNTKGTRHTRKNRKKRTDTETHPATDPRRTFDPLTALSQDMQFSSCGEKMSKMRERQ